MKKQILTGLLLLPLVVSANQALTISGELELSVLADLELSDFKNDTLDWRVDLTSGSDVIAHASNADAYYGLLHIDCKAKTSIFTHSRDLLDFNSKSFSLSKKTTDALTAKFCE
jgi:hypothetical protein